MLCKDVMRRPVEFITADETAEVAARKMRDANVGFLPVLSDSKRVIGVLTDRDLALRVCAENTKPSKAPVRTIMSREPICCQSNEELRRAQELMSLYHRSRIVVLDELGELAGVISLADIAAQGEPFAAETLREVARREVLDAHGHLGVV